MVAFWLLGSFAIEAALLTFNVTVAIFVVAQMVKRKPLFDSAFFVIYVLESGVASAHYLIYTFEIQFQGDNLYPSDWLSASESEWLLLITGYFTFFPLLSHTAIALNRYTAIVWPTRHVKIWTGKALVFVVILLFVLPLGGAGVTGAIKLDDGATSASFNMVAGGTSVFIILGTCVLSGIVDFRTFWTYKKLSASKKQQYRDDFRLLIFAVFGLIVHLLAVMMYAGMFFLSAPYPTIGYALRVFSQYYVDILCFYGPICLFVSSVPVRNGYLVFFRLKKKGAVTVLPKYSQSARTISYEPTTTWRIAPVFKS
ncbi:hypothetical protein AAVH_16336 [Aphelenchoides avenae]|nr:hypothetical protein AAVH_16336 [Aphelenchus avenae]